VTEILVEKHFNESDMS